MRELDGLQFAVVVLRVSINGSDVEADVAYLDDGNIERGVPADELMQGHSEQFSEELISKRYQEGFVALEDESEESNARPGTASTMSTMRWEQGRYVEDDGAVIFTADGERPNSLKNISPKEFSKILGDPVCGASLKGIRLIRKSRLADREAQATGAA